MLYFSNKKTLERASMQATLSSILPNLKAVFFDLDDVLVFSETTHTKAWQMSLPKFGINPNEIDFQSLVGISDMQQAIRFKEQFALKEDPKLLFELKRNTFFELSKMGFKSPLGRNSFLERLSQSVIVGVVSSSVQKVINQVLSLEEISSFFHFIIGYEDCERHKPDPLPYQNALARAGIKPHEALVIEDSVSGIRAAQSALIPVVGILKDQRPDQILKEVKYFSHFSEIHAELFDK